MEYAKDNYTSIGIEYHKVKKKENKVLKWIRKNRIFFTIIAFTISFSIINIVLIIQFFSILANL